MKQRIVYLDLIKIIAAYLVIFTHTGDIGSKLYIYGDYGLCQDILYVALDAFRTINVPLFFMVSGALLLGKDESYSQLFKKHILKYCLVIVFISYFYFIAYKAYDEYTWYNFGFFLKRLYSGSVVGLFWFLYAYLGYLLILPFIRRMVRNMTVEDYGYLLILGILFKGIIEVIGSLVIDSSFGVSCTLVTDVIFYPIMGHYLANVIEKKFVRKHLYGGSIALVISILCAVSMTYWDMDNTGEFSENYLFSFTVIPTLYMFYLIKFIGTKLLKYKNICRLINSFGECSFGVYLFGLYLQVELIDTYWKIYDHLMLFPLLSCLLYVGYIVLVAVFITFILKRIPVVKKML